MGVLTAIIFVIVMVVVNNLLKYFSFGLVCEHIGEDAYFVWYVIFLIYWAYRYYYYWKKVRSNQNGLLQQHSTIRSTTTTMNSQTNYPPYQPQQPYPPHQPQQHYPQPYVAVADIWKQWAAPEFLNEMAIRNYMDRIQMQRGGPRIRLLKATMIANEGPCRNFISSIHGDRWLFHGASEANASNIQAEGLLMRHASNGLLDRGLYGYQKSFYKPHT